MIQRNPDNSLKIDVDFFTLVDQSYVCEISDLDLKNNVLPWKIIVKRPDGEYHFCLVGTFRDSDNDITHWNYLPGGSNPKVCIRNFKVVLFND
jgi:predicted SnoaL-like aldol condensation-catalyzing enzyme